MRPFEADAAQLVAVSLAAPVYFVRHKPQCALQSARYAALAVGGQAGVGGHQPKKKVRPGGWPRRTSDYRFSPY